MNDPVLSNLVSFIIGVLSSITAHYIIVRSRGNGFWFYRLIWSPPWKRKLKPSIRGADDLEQLIRLLGNIERWLSKSDMILIDDIRRGFWKAICILQIERYRYIAQFSDKEEEREFAIRQFSLIDSDRAREVATAILSSPTESKRLKSFASQMLDKINEYQENERKALEDWGKATGEKP